MHTAFPTRWKTHRLDELGLVSRGRSRHRPRNDPSLYGGDHPFFQTGDIKAANLYLSDYSQTYNEKGLAQSKEWEPGTLCITIAANIAETAILKVRGCFPDSVIGFVADPSKADPLFIKYYVDYMKVDMQAVSHGTTQDNLSANKLLRVEFVVPDVEEQRRIAVILSAYDHLIENNLRRIKILDEMAHNLYREWFVEFRFPDYENAHFAGSPIGRIPEGWVSRRVMEFGRVVTGRTPSKANPAFYGEDVPFVKIPDMRRGTFIVDVSERLSYAGTESQADKTIPAGSICVSCIGTIGLVSLTTEVCQTNQQINSVVLADEAFREFLFYRLRDARQALENLGSNGATMGNVNKGKFESLEIIAPPRQIAVRYHEHVSSLFDAMLNLYRQNATLRRTRDLLLPKLISGELDVSELDIAVPEEVGT